MPAPRACSLLALDGLASARRMRSSIAATFGAYFWRSFATAASRCSRQALADPQPEGRLVLARRG